MDVILTFLLLLILLAIGVPVAFSVGIAGTVGLLFMFDINQTGLLMLNSTYPTVVSFVFAVLPAFVLMAKYLEYSRITSDVYDFFYTWVGFLPGGLAICTTITNGLLAALSGSSTAVAAAMSRVAIPEMRKYGYKDTLAAGTVAASGTFASMIPPSMLLIFYGILAEESIGQLFIAAIIPGILTVIGYVILIMVWATLDKDMEKVKNPKDFTFTKRVKSSKKVIPAAAIMVTVIGSIYIGAVTPLEAGVFGAAATFVVGLTIYNLTIEETWSALEDTISITAMILLIVMAAKIYGTYLTMSGVVGDILTFVISLPISELTLIFLVILFYIALGTFMSALSAIIITLPITLPLVESLGFSALWFGIILAKSVEVGLVTPPFGLNVFVTCAPIDLEVNTAFAGSMRFLIVDVLIIILLVFYPEIIYILL